MRQALSPRFVLAALIATLTLGSSFGAYNLLMLHWALGPVPSAHHLSHAQFQVWGFALLSIMGVSYDAVPRLLHTELRWIPVARATLWLSVAALLLLTRGHLSGLLSPAPEALLAGGILQFLAVLGWVAVLAATRRSSGAPHAPFQRYWVAGSLWWLAAAALVLASTGVAFERRDPAAVASFSESIYAAALFGGALGWLLGTGVLLRDFRNGPSPRPWLLATAFWLAQGGAALASVGPLLSGRGGQLTADIGLLAVAAAVVTFALGVRPLPVGALPVLTGDPDSPTLARALCVGSAVFVASATAYATLDLASLTPSRLLYDGARHAFTLGVVASLILGASGRVVATCRAASMRWPRLRVAGVLLIAASVVLRQAEIAAAYLHAPGLLYISGASGLVAATGVSLASAAIVATVASRSRTPASG